MRKRAGFTLVELLIVIVVIAILAAIAIVSYGGIQKRAKDVTIKSDLTNAGKVVSLWMVDNSMAGLNDIFNSQMDGSRTSAWITGVEADNDLSDRQLRWNDVEELPSVQVSPGVTMEVIGHYGGNNAAVAPDANQRMLDNNYFCITAAITGGTYDYRPMSGVPARYDHLLFFDSALGGVVTMEQLVKAQSEGRPVTCEAHLVMWQQATS